MKRIFVIFVVLLSLFSAHAQTWTSIPITSASRISCIRSDPHHPGTVYFASLGVIAGTSDQGKTWFYKNFSNYSNIKPFDFQIDIEIPDRWYMACGVSGYMLSTDAGTTWRYLNDGLQRTYWWNFFQIVQDYQRPHIMYLMSNERIYKSTDRGETWKSLPLAFYANAAKEFATALVMNQRDPDSLYVFVKNTPIKRWISGDQGRTWVPDSSEIGNLRTHTITKDGELLVGSHRSVDYGKTWSQVLVLDPDRPPDQSENARSIDYCVYDPVSKCYYLGNLGGLFRRDPDDQIWRHTGVSSYVRLVHYDLPTQTLWWTTHVRIYSSRDAVASFDEVTSGPYLASVEWIATGNYKGDRIMTITSMTQDNGKTWSRPTGDLHFTSDNDYDDGYGGPLQPIAISPVDSSFIVRIPSAWPVYTTNGWSPEVVWKPSLLAVVINFSPLYFNPHNPHEIFGGSGNGFYRITDSLLFSFTNYSGHFTSPRPWVIFPPYINNIPDSRPPPVSTCFTFHPELDGIYYLCTIEPLVGNTTFSTFYKSTDRGATWTPLLDGISNGYTQICVNPVNPDIIVISSNEGIYRSSDDGRTWSKNNGYPFQSLALSSLIIDPRYPNIYYCGAKSFINETMPGYPNQGRSGGMYVSYDYAKTWEALPLDGMHNVSVLYIHYHENPRRLIVSTWGGLFEMLLPDYPTTTTPLPAHAGLELRVFPNPATVGDMQTLRVYGAGGKHALIDLYNIHGQHISRVYDGTLEAGATLQQSTAALPTGIYYYRVLAAGEQRCTQVVIRK